MLLNSPDQRTATSQKSSSPQSADAEKPKTQRATVFFDEPIEP